MLSSSTKLSKKVVYTAMTRRSHRVSLAETYGLWQNGFLCPFATESDLFQPRPDSRHTYSSSATVSYQRDVADTPDNGSRSAAPAPAGSKAFVTCELFALIDLFDKFALPLDTIASNNTKYINLDGLRRLLNAVGESPADEELQQILEQADTDDNGVIDLDVSVLGFGDAYPFA
jgi:hypothetical protein